MKQETVFPFRIEVTREKLTAHGGLALMAELLVNQKWEEPRGKARLLETATG